MAVSKELLSFAPIDVIAKESEMFPYGAATARKLGQENLNRSGRVMIKRMEDIINAFELPFRVPQKPTVLSHDNGNAFVNVLSSNAEFFVMARNPLSGKSIEELNGKAFHRNIITGICLFSSDSVKAVAEDGEEFSFTAPDNDITKPIVDFRVSQQLSVYEIESIVRLSAFISTLQSNNGSGKVLLNNPRVEYYLYLLPALEKGFVDVQQALSWFYYVDERYEKLSGIMKKRLSRNLPEDCIVSFNSLDIIRDAIVDSVWEGQIPQISKVKDKLAGYCDLWANIFKVEDPDTWNKLNYLSYAHAYLDAAEKTGLLVAVENPTESKIFALAKKLSSSIRPVRACHHDIIGLYPHEMVLPKGDAAKKTMYHVADPENKTSAARVIFQAYKCNGGNK